MWHRRRDIDPLSTMLPPLPQHPPNIPQQISEITNSDVSILPRDHLTDLLLYGSKAYNSISNDLILTETILFIYKSERFKHLEAFAWLCLSWSLHIPPRAAPITKPLWTSLSNIVRLCINVFCTFVFFLYLWVCDGARRRSFGCLYPSTHEPSFLYVFIVLLGIQKKPYFMALCICWLATI